MSEHAWSYRHGSWLGIFGTGASLVLPPSEKHRVAALWALVDDGAGVEPVLDALVSGGLSSLSDFVLVGHDAASTTVVARGTGVKVHAVDAESTVDLDPSTARTWIEHTFTALAALTIHVDDDPDTDGPSPPDLAIDSGLVRVSRVDHPAQVAPDDDTNRVVAPAADLHLLDDDTAAGIDDSEFTRAQPGIPGQEPAPGITTTVARLMVSNGETVDVDRVVLVGRAPEARRFTSSDQPTLVSVPSPLHEISATHVEIRPGSGADHGSAVVTDMGSTNGTVVIQPGLSPEGLKPGIPVQLIPGATINLGDGVTITVTQP